eukprot:CCRYP_005744-RA/>CCRYP_005744-RA protein AED:0.55 eAED:0.55 QI:0/0/0/0.5/0/0/2/0/119
MHLTLLSRDQQKALVFTNQHKINWCSRASAKQRSGRAERVQPGICLKIYSSYTANTVMQPTSLPELQCMLLEEICLSILPSRFQRVAAISCLRPPSHHRMTTSKPKAAVTVLHDIGAIQ